jgi:endonuclease/exonuclease/phosphatase family metal-dependent hydrolase
MGVFCTHLAVNIPDDTGSTEQGGEPSERQTQIDALLDYVDEKKGDTKLLVAMGDMNCGPEAGDAKATDPDDFQRLTSRGLSASYVNDSAFCTWCGDNELVPEGDDNNLIDHILFSGLSKRDNPTATRVLDARVNIKVDGKAVKSQLSDHYGLEVKVSRR